MLRYHMNVITRDAALRRSIRRLTTATGATADFPADGQVSEARPVDLVVFDARESSPDRRFLAQVPRGASLLYIIPGAELPSRIPLLADERVVSLFCHDERFDDDEFISTATKALRGEIFGLQKYFPWGVTTFTMLVKNYEDKGRAIDIMMRYAQHAGVRGPVRDRIQLVADELMMNALYHAPVDEDGRERFRGMSVKQLAQLDQVGPIQVQYGCSGRYFGLAVRDSAGSLGRARALEYLSRARDGAEMEEKESGAGLGLVSVLRSVSKLVFNLSPTSSTEVIALHDMELAARGIVGARSLHMFTAPPSADAPDDEDEADESFPRVAATRARGRAGGWIAAGILGAAVAGGGTAFYLESMQPEALAIGDEPRDRSPALIIYPDPEAADITVDGVAVAAGVAVPFLRRGQAGPIEIRVSHAGYRPWSRSLLAAELSAGATIYVRLDRDE